MRYIVGDLLTGRRIQTLQADSGSWSETLNDAGEVSCTVPLNDPVNRALGLANSAAVGKAFLAAVEGDLVLQAGPIWAHDFSEDENRLTLAAAGMWSYFDHRVLLPVLAGRNPTDVTTDTRYSDVVSNPDAVGYPWPVDTRKPLQVIAKQLVAQAQTATGGNVPVVLPADEVGALAERWYKGSAVGMVGARLREVAGVEGGPDIMFTPRLQADRMGVEWVMRIGTPAQPMLFSPQRQTFRLGIAAPSLSRLRVHVDGTRMASQAFAVGGRTDGQGLIAVQSDPTLVSQGYPLLEEVDSSHSTVSEQSALEGYAREIVLAGKRPRTTWSFDHQLSQRPFLESFNAGDFARVSVRDNAYLMDGSYSMRLLSRSGDISGERVSLQFAPEVV